MTKQIVRLFAILLTLTLLLGLCACNASKPQETDPALQQQEVPSASATTTDPQELEPVPTDSQHKDPSKNDILIEKMQLLLGPESGSWFNYALNSEFATPEDVNLHSLFRNGFEDDSHDLPSEDELEYLKDKILYDDLSMMSLIRLSPARMDEVLQEYFGTTLEECNKIAIGLFAYWEKTDTYYGVYTRNKETSLYVRNVEEQSDGSIYVYYTSDKDMVATLVPKEDGYILQSNLPARMLNPDAEIEQMQWLIDHQYGTIDFINDALTSDYATPEDVNLCYLFYDGFDDETKKPTEEELILLDGKFSQHWKNEDLIRLPSDKMDAVLTELFQIKLEDTKKVGLDNLVYLEETDCYYMVHTGTSYAEIIVSKVEYQSDDVILVYYSRVYPAADMVVTMKKNGDSYQILSNTLVE